MFINFSLLKMHLSSLHTNCFHFQDQTTVTDILNGECTKQETNTKTHDQPTCNFLYRIEQTCFHDIFQFFKTRKQHWIMQLVKARLKHAQTDNTVIIANKNGYYKASLRFRKWNILKIRCCFHIRFLVDFVFLNRERGIHSFPFPFVSWLCWFYFFFRFVCFPKCIPIAIAIMRIDRMKWKTDIFVQLIREALGFQDDLFNPMTDMAGLKIPCT